MSKKLILVTENGEQHGVINTVANSVKAEDGYKNMAPDVKERVMKRKKHDAEIVKARYINHRGMHERLTKPYCRYAGDPIDTYHLIPGHTYDLPRGFVDEVNNNPGLVKRSGLVSQDGKDVNNGQPLAKDQGTLRLHELVPAGF
jgi:hypothetical protein